MANSLNSLITIPCTFKIREFIRVVYRIKCYCIKDNFSIRYGMHRAVVSNSAIDLHKLFPWLCLVPDGATATTFSRCLLFGHGAAVFQTHPVPVDRCAAWTVPSVQAHVEAFICGQHRHTQQEHCLIWCHQDAWSDRYITR